MSAEPVKLHTILVVDDTPENVSLLAAILSAEYTIVSASCGSEALRIAQELQPDLILLDIMMPGMNGYDVCTALKGDAVTKRIPVIFVSALLGPGDETRGFDVGGVDYLTKPVVGLVVRSRVKAHLALSAAQNEMEEWNNNLKKKLLQNITTIRLKTAELISAEERATGLIGHIQCVELLSGVFALMEDRFGACSRAVSELAGDAARVMKLSGEEIAKVRLAGLLHDVGTLGAVRTVSEKNVDEMYAHELRDFHAHPGRGQELFAALTEIQDVGLMVRGHHEAFDGSGFPDGLKGDSIPLGARLVAIASFIEHAASSVSGARDEYAIMRARLHSGTQLDPGLITYFTSITRIMYFNGRKPSSISEVEVPIKELISGMVLSRDLINVAGVLLLQKGDILDTCGIALIRRSNQSNRATDSGVWLFAGATETEVEGADVER